MNSWHNEFGASVRCLSSPQLLAAKRAANRPQDQAGTWLAPVVVRELGTRRLEDHRTIEPRGNRTGGHRQPAP
jgi:hypothetical protein